MKTLFELFCWAILLGMMICISAAHSDELRIAVIDTGIDLKDTRINSHLCATGHVDFTEEGLQDDIGHGTAIVGLIEQYAKDSNYCIVMIKWYGEKGTANGKTFLIRELKEAVAQKVDIINMSLSGPGYSMMEQKIICAFKGIVVAASGNQGIDLDVDPRYPAAYKCPNLITVGGSDYLNSNIGTMVRAWENAKNVPVLWPNGLTGHSDGTSNSAAIYTGKYIYAISHKSH